jgi:hypothetical protein
MNSSTLNASSQLSTHLNAQLSSACAKSSHLFLFLEIFAREGGIQSYVQDIFRGLEQQQQPADVFLLRDAPFENPFASDCLKFHLSRHHLSSDGYNWPDAC